MGGGGGGGSSEYCSSCPPRGEPEVGGWGGEEY